MPEHRLRLLAKRLDKDKNLKTTYTSGIKDLLEKGNAEKVENPQPGDSNNCSWYLPHHPVVHPRKPGKVRCAAKYQGMSLNDKVMQGPDLTNKLVGVLQRFRQEPVALMADIEGMYHQVWVHKHDRDYLRFLWFANDNTANQSVVHRMTAHLFGGVWSPSCANFALRKCASDKETSYDQETIKTVQNNFYVDDCLRSVPTPEKAIKIISELRHLLSTGGFHLTKFLSNSREVMKTIPESERSKTMAELDLDMEDLPSERALGVLWSSGKRQFHLQHQHQE